MFRIILISFIALICVACGEIEVKKEYYDDGKLRNEIPYKNGVKHGVAKWYHKNGKLRSEIPYQNGYQHGIEKLYYENGNLELEIPYQNGEAHGVLKWYHENGKLKIQLTHENGKMISGKCGNGKILTNAHLQIIKNRFYSGDAINEVCSLK